MLQNGDVIIFPTDTVYGIATRVGDNLGLKKIYEIKQRSLSKKLPVMISSFIDINKIATYTNRDFIIMKHFWPGNLTVVLNSTISFYELTGEKTVALRIPNSKLACEILDTYGPMWVTSVNNSGEPAINDYNLIKEKYDKLVSKIYPPQNSFSSGVSSTVIDLTSSQIKILRQGDISLEKIEKLVKKGDK